MNNNQNAPTQLGCSLFTQATASLQSEIEDDLQIEDVSLEKILGKVNNESKTPEDNKQDNC